MNDEQLLLRLFQVVHKTLRHKHYQHTVDKRTLYRALVAGVGLDAKLMQFTRREDAIMFDQRKALTQHITTAVCASLLDVFRKVPRSNSARRVLTSTRKNGEREHTKQMEDVLEKFWGDSSFDDWMATRFIELNANDPNAYCIIEWRKHDATERLQPRPRIAYSDAVLDHLYDNNELQYVIVRDSHMYKLKSKHGNRELTDTEKLDPNYGKKKGYKYTLYGKNQTVKLVQIDKTFVQGTGASAKAGVIRKTSIDGNAVDVVKLNSKYFILERIKPHNLGTVPAFRVGYNRDEATNGETYVYPLQKCESYLLKTIKVNSELDLVASLLAHPHQVAYGNTCPTCHGTGTDVNGNSCGTCDNSGVVSTRSSQERTLIPKPKSKEEHIPLPEWIHYEHPPVEIIKWQSEYVDKLVEQCKRIMFMGETFTKTEVAETAHGKDLDMQNVYDALLPLAVRFSKIWVLGVNIMSGLTQLKDNLVFSHSFGKDFKLKTMSSLIAELKFVNGLGAPAVVDHIQDDIAQLIYADRPVDLQRYRIMKAYNPFAGKSEAEVLIGLSSSDVTRQDKVLHMNFNRIFDELELEAAKEGENFYDYTRPVIREKIYAKVDELVAKLEAEKPKPRINLGDEAVKPDDGEEPTEDDLE